MPFLFRFGILFSFALFSGWSAKKPNVDWDADPDRAAYRAHYEGKLAFENGKVNRAQKAFRTAYLKDPTNAHFAFAWAVTLGQAGKISQALQLIRQSRAGLSRSDPDYAQKHTLSFFFEGMVLLYSGNYEAAGERLRTAEHLLSDEVQEDYIRTVVYNALGYINIVLQTASRSGALDLHYHVSREDMERAAQYFQKAIKFGPDNESAVYNYTYLMDTVGFPDWPDPKDLPRHALSQNQVFSYSNNLEQAVDRLQLQKYDELLFLLDISGSMVLEEVTCLNRSRFEVLRQTTSGFVRKLPTDARAGFASIDGDCGEPPRKWFPVGSLNKAELLTEIRFLAPHGATPMLERLEASLELFTDSINQKCIFLISDGANTCKLPGLDICQWADRARSKGYTIHVLTFLDATFNNATAFTDYSCLADQTGGEIIYIDNYRCRLTEYEFDLSHQCLPRIPSLRQVKCFGLDTELWAFFPEN